MIGSLSLEEKNITKDTKKFFRLKKSLNDTAIKDIGDRFRLEKWNKAVKDIILRNIRYLFENEEEE